MTSVNNFTLFLLFLFISIINFTADLSAQCTENYQWVKKQDICGDPNNGSTTILFENTAVPCNPGNGNMDLHVYYFINPGPAQAPSIYDPLQGVPFETTTPLPNSLLTYLGSINAPDLCASGYFFTHSFVNSMACSGNDVTFFLIPWDRDLDSDNDGVFGEYNQTGTTCAIEREEFTILGAPCNPLLECTIEREPETCDGGPGFATVSASGGVMPYSYVWSNGSTSPTATGLQSGTHYVTVTDAAGCTKETFTFINPPNAALVCSLTPTNVSCNGGADGSITASVIVPGTGCDSLAYIWSTGDTTLTITGLMAGTYTLTVSSVECCPTECTITITEPPVLINVIGNIVSNVCAGSSDGSAVGTGVGGVPPYSYNWSNGTTDQIVTGLPAGTYVLTITDAQGCTATNAMMIIDGPVLMTNVTSNDVTCNGNEDGELTATATNPNNPVTYTWSDGQNSQTATGLSPGTYTVTVTDAQGCTGTASGTIGEPNKLSATVAITDEWCGVTLGEATVTASNGTSGYMYVWSDGQTSSTATGLAAGEYSVTVLDSKGCCILLSVIVGLDDCDLCTEAENGVIDICTILATDPSHPIGMLDCDNGGVINATECANGGDPLDPSDDCSIAESTSMDICAEITSNPDSPFATLDCDEGGVTNEVECATGADPFDPQDDCQSALDAELNLCELINYDMNHPLATLDCDNGGISNYIECVEGAGDPSDPIDDCYSAVIADVDLCAIIDGDPAHPWASLDCDNGGIPNLEECVNGADPADPIDDEIYAPEFCVEAVLGIVDICDTLSVDPSHPLSTLDCDGDGVTNEDECTDGTDPLDPCDFEEASISGPITADQSGCDNLCPDLTPVTTILPGNIAGISAVEVAVEITELNNIDTDGSIIVVRVPSDPRLAFSWDPGLMMAALTPVQNSDWNYQGDNGIVRTWIYQGPSLVIGAGATSAFGFQAIYDPQFTDGQTTITASIVPFGGGECNILNDTDSERLVYFE